MQHPAPIFGVGSLFGSALELRMLHLAKEFASDELGASLIEYSLLIGLLSGAIVVSISAISGNLATLWSNVASAMATAA